MGKDQVAGLGLCKMTAKAPAAAAAKVSGAAAAPIEVPLADAVASGSKAATVAAAAKRPPSKQFGEKKDN